MDHRFKVGNVVVLKSNNFKYKVMSTGRGPFTNYPTYYLTSLDFSNECYCYDHDLKPITFKEISQEILNDKRGESI